MPVLSVQEMQAKVGEFVKRCGGDLYEGAYDLLRAEQSPVGVILTSEAFRGPLRPAAEYIRGEGPTPGIGEYELCIAFLEGVAQAFGQVDGALAPRVRYELSEIRTEGAGLPLITVFEKNYYICLVFPGQRKEGQVKVSKNRLKLPWKLVEDDSGPVGP